MIKRLIILLTAIISFPQCFAAEKASDILDRTAKKFSSAPSISAYYTISSANGTSSGEMLFAGQKFHIKSPELLTWYDGTTQWSYLPSENEVNISEPTAEELQSVNPFTIISTFKRGYTAKVVKTDKSVKVITLTAQSKKAEIQSATLTINASTMLPSRIDLKMLSGQKATITITRLSIGKQVNINAFRFPAKKYPGVETVDLR